MKAITENVIRDEIRNTHPDVYYIKAGCILTPAAREYLQQEKILIAKEGEEVPTASTELTSEQKKNSFHALTPSYKELSNEKGCECQNATTTGFVDFETGAHFDKKPETMTHLYGNVLVRKDHERIYFRGKLDSAQSLVVFAQAVITQLGEKAVVDDLSTILNALREVMRADVLNDEIKPIQLLGMTFEEIHERSHNPMKYYNIKQCKLPDFQLGRSYALLNMVRSNVREVEVAAAKAFVENRRIVRPDIIEALNRISSAMHVMMCKYDACEYKGAKNE